MKQMYINTDTAFEVRHSQLLNYIISAACFAMFIGYFYTVSDWKSLMFIPIMLFLGFVAFFFKAYINKLIIRIDDSGILYRNNLVCNWKCFESVYLGHEFIESTGGQSERYYILITFLDNLKVKFQYKIIMSDTQDRSEEEIIYAINEFYKKNKI